MVDGECLSFEKEVKNLGVRVDQFLSGDPWVRHVSRGAIATLNRFYRCGVGYLPINARHSLGLLKSFKLLESPESFRSLKSF
jgi:hypothetical protein